MKNKMYYRINSITLEQKIGQLIIGQAEGYEMTPGFEAYIRRYPLCGYRVNGSNIESYEQVREFTSSIKKLYKITGAGIDPLLASDQEGGSLSVFGNLITEFPGNMALGAACETGLAYLQANVLGYKLSEMGINMAFAPVADINLQINNPVIGVRSFGDDPLKVFELCRAYAEGLNSGGVAGCAKHFPGHGNTNVDSHMALPENNTDFESFEKTELIPFARLAAANIDSFMVSHVLYPGITGDSLPASLSGKIIQDILRTKLKYTGVVMTDDLEMRAVTSNFSIRQAVRMFILAGGDIVLINGTRKAAIEAFESLLEAVDQGIISMNRINESVIRVLALKDKIARYNLQRKLIVKNPEELSKEISKKAITLVRDHRRLLALKNDSRILLIIPGQINLTDADTTGGIENNLFKYMKNHTKAIRLYKTELGKIPDIKEILMLSEECDIIVQCTINCVRFPEQIEIIKQLIEIKPVLTIMLRDPYDAMLIPDDAAVIAAFSAIDSNMEITSDMIFGKYEFTGKLPVSMG